MLVWRSTSQHPTATPACLAGAPGLVRLETSEGVLVTLGGETVAPLLGYRADVEWHPAEDGWMVADYGSTDHALYRRRLPWAVPLEIEDGRSNVWHVPAVLSPIGTPAIDMASRLTDAGWIEEAPTLLARRALDAAYAALPYVRENRLHEVELATANSWIVAILEATYHLSALTIGRLGFITATLRFHGLRCACGVVQRES